MFISSASYAQKVIKKIDRTVNDIEEASDVISEFGKDAKDLVDGIKGLFGGKKNKSKKSNNDKNNLKDDLKEIPETTVGNLKEKSGPTKDEVTLVVSGDGQTKQEATHNALRNAIEQAFGVFVSANTDIFNDEIVRDEIATVSSGNIKSYEELAYSEEEGGKALVTLKATVSIGKLVEYSKKHGSKAEFDANRFAANAKLARLNESNAVKTYLILLRQLYPLILDLYDYSIDVVPRVDGEVIFNIKALANSNTAKIGETIFNTLVAISSNEAEAQPLIEMGFEMVPCYVNLYKYNHKDRGHSMKRYFFKSLMKELKRKGLNYILCPMNYLSIKADSKYGELYFVRVDMLNHYDYQGSTIERGEVCVLDDQGFVYYNGRKSPFNFFTAYIYSRTYSGKRYGDFVTQGFYTYRYGITDDPAYACGSPMGSFNPLYGDHYSTDINQGYTFNYFERVNVFLYDVNPGEELYSFKIHGKMTEKELETVSSFSLYEFDYQAFERQMIDWFSKNKETN